MGKGSFLTKISGRLGLSSKATAERALAPNEPVKAFSRSTGGTGRVEAASEPFDERRAKTTESVAGPPRAPDQQGRMEEFHYSIGPVRMANLSRDVKHEDEAVKPGADSSESRDSAVMPTTDWPKQRIPFNGCPLCGNQNSQMLRTANCTQHQLYHPIVAPMVTWLRCKDCDHVYTDGYFSNEVAQVIFQGGHDQQSPGWNFEQQRMISARIIERVARFASGGAWLDVGFGNGSLLFTAEEWGFSPYGIDLRQQSVTAMQHLGIEARCVDLAALEEPGRFSVISMADVLEHMPFPREGLAAAKRLLRPDGVLFASMPNYNCTAWQLLDRINDNPYWAELEHFHNFSRIRLHALLHEMGFEPVHYAVSERYRVCMEIVAKNME